jgi:hypothetical protein
LLLSSLYIALQGATMSELARISIALNHLTGVAAGLVPATLKFLAQGKIIEVAWRQPGHDPEFRFNKCRTGDTIARYPNAAHLCCRRHAGTWRRFAP